MNSLLAMVFSLVATLLVGGCNTTGSSTTQSRSTKEPIILRKGMSSSEVREVLGDPLSVSSKVGAEGTLETWTYEETQEFTRQVQADVREVPYTNPITRETTTIEEPVIKIKTDRITLTTELFILQGELIGWKESTQESSSFQD